jgi:DNA polymerase-3 subunit delta
MPQEKTTKQSTTSPTTQPNIFLFYGEDTYSSNQKAKFWRDQFMKKYGDNSNIEIFDGKTLDITQFATNIGTIPFLCEKRLIIIKNFLSTANREDQKSIATTLEKAPPFCILVFHETSAPDKVASLYKKIKKIGKIEEFKHLTPLELTNWILKQAKSQNINISRVTANYLSLHCGSELWRISSELEKLKTFANNQEITQEMIDEFVTPSLSASIFKLTDAISEKNPKVSIRTLETLKETGEELTRIFFMIVRHFRILLQVHEMASKGENQYSITKKLKQHPFVIQKTLSQSKNFTQEQLEKIYAALLQIDIDFKTGIIKSYQGDDSEYKLAMEKLIIECCS